MGEGVRVRRSEGVRVRYWGEGVRVPRQGEGVRVRYWGEGVRVPRQGEGVRVRYWGEGVRIPRRVHKIVTSGGPPTVTIGLRATGRGRSHRVH
jgi:hypothetical protein